MTFRTVSPYHPPYGWLPHPGGDLEGVVRPFVAVTMTPTLRTYVGPPEILPDAHIRWGQPSAFDSSEWDPVRYPDQGPTQMRPRPPAPFFEGTYEEEARAWSDFSVIDPEDEGNKVVIRRIDSIAFTAPGKLIEDPRTPFLDFVKVHDQVVFTFTNTSSQEGDEDKAYLKNSADEPFEPVIVDALTDIIEVGWPRVRILVVSAWGVSGGGGVILELEKPGVAEYEDMHTQFHFHENNPLEPIASYNADGEIVKETIEEETALNEDGFRTQNFITNLVSGITYSDGAEDKFIHPEIEAGRLASEPEEWEPSVVDDSQDWHDPTVWSAYGGWLALEPHPFSGSAFDLLIIPEQSYRIILLVDPDTGAPIFDDDGQFQYTSDGNGLRSHTEVAEDINKSLRGEIPGMNLPPDDDEEPREEGSFPYNEWRLNEVGEHTIGNLGSSWQPMGPNRIQYSAGDDEFGDPTYKQFFVYRLWITEWFTKYDRNPIALGGAAANLKKTLKYVGVPPILIPGTPREPILIRAYHACVPEPEDFSGISRSNPAYPLPFDAPILTLRWAVYKGNKGLELFDKIKEKVIEVFDEMIFAQSREPPLPSPYTDTEIWNILLTAETDLDPFEAEGLFEWDEMTFTPPPCPSDGSGSYELIEVDATTVAWKTGN